MLQQPAKAKVSCDKGMGRGKVGMREGGDKMGDKVREEGGVQGGGKRAYLPLGMSVSIASRNSMDFVMLYNHTHTHNSKVPASTCTHCVPYI